MVTIFSFATLYAGKKEIVAVVSFFIQQNLGIRRKSFNQPQAFSTNPFNFFKGSTEISHLTQIGH